jgi:hypothetical protein
MPQPRALSFRKQAVAGLGIVGKFAETFQADSLETRPFNSSRIILGTETRIEFGWGKGIRRTGPGKNSALIVGQYGDHFIFPKKPNSRRRQNRIFPEIHLGPFHLGLFSNAGLGSLSFPMIQDFVIRKSQ